MSYQFCGNECPECGSGCDKKYGHSHGDYDGIARDCWCSKCGGWWLEGEPTLLRNRYYTRGEMDIAVRAARIEGAKFGINSQSGKHQHAGEYLTDPLALAVLFHVTYERLEPSNGYETRKETHIFDPESSNGKLMIATCAEIQRIIRE